MATKAEKLQLTDIKGKAVVITGGTTGIGRATAILLASHGAHVLIFGREKQPLEDALEDIGKVSKDVVGLTADTSKKNDVLKVFKTADEKLGGVDILIDNAALGAGPVAESRHEELEYIVKTNLLGYITSAYEAIKRMKQKKDGHIVVIGSMSADTREGGSSLYVATKSGIQGLTEALRKEVNKLGIRVSLIEPGEVGTDMQPMPPEEQRKKQAELTQLMAEDIADTIYYVLTRPKRVDIIEIKVRPHLQII